MFTITRRRRNVLLACTAVAAGGYVSYRIYNSRKRLRVFLLFQSLTSLLEALSHGSNTVALVLDDLHAFLLSNEDEVPQTLKQLLKIASSHEAQKSVTALSSAISRGVLTTLLNGGSVAVSLKHEENPHKPDSPRSRLLSPRKPGYSEETKDVIKWGAKDDAALQGRNGSARISIDDRALFPDEEGNSEEIWRDCNGVWDVGTWASAGNILEGVKAQVDSSIAKGAKEALKEEIGEGSNSSRNEAGAHSGGATSAKEKFVDRLVEKLFSESGKGFASAVVASASRSFVVSVLEHINSSSVSSRGDGAGEPLKVLVDFASSAKGRTLLTDCIQTFVGTAVSVYLDRTKDINTFDELVAGLVKPEHRGPITDLLTTVCQVSASSFVRTSHDVLTSDPSSSRQRAGANLVSASLNPGGFSYDDYDDTEVFYDDLGDQEGVPSPGWKGKSTGGRRDDAVPMDLIEGLSKALAVPSNRKLILDIAGTMTSEGVRSMIDVSLAKVSGALCGKGKEPALKDHEYEASKRSGVSDTLQVVGDMTKAAIDKSMVLMTMCFAICMHSVVGGVKMFQPF